MKCAHLDVWVSFVDINFAKYAQVFNVLPTMQFYINVHSPTFQPALSTLWKPSSQKDATREFLKGRFFINTLNHKQKY